MRFIQETLRGIKRLEEAARGDFPIVIFVREKRAIPLLDVFDGDIEQEIESVPPYWTNLDNIAEPAAFFGKLFDMRMQIALVVENHHRMPTGKARLDIGQDIARCLAAARLPKAYRIFEIRRD